MSYQIEAYLDKGVPSLKIYSAYNQALCLSWTFDTSKSQAASHTEIHQLFKKLLLLTCKQDLNNVRVFRVNSS